MSEKPEDILYYLNGIYIGTERGAALHAEIERLKAVALQAQNAAIDLAKENERLREALAWAYNLRHLRGHSDPVVIPERFAPSIEAALKEVPR